MLPEYTILTLIFGLVTFFLDNFFLKTKIWLKKEFYFLMILVTFFQTIVDNWLNGRWGFGSFIVGPYPDEFFSGIIFWHTPLENYVFGWILIWMNVVVFEYLRNSKKFNLKLRKSKN